MDRLGTAHLKMLEAAADGNTFARLQLQIKAERASREGFWLSPFVVEWNDDDHSLTITRPKNWTGEVVEWWKTMKKEADEKADLGQHKGERGL